MFCFCRCRIQFGATERGKEERDEEVGDFRNGYKGV